MGEVGSEAPFNPLAPTHGGKKKEDLGTPQTPAAFCCSVMAQACRGALYAPGTPLILRRVYDQTLGIRLRRTAPVHTPREGEV